MQSPCYRTDGFSQLITVAAVLVEVGISKQASKQASKHKQHKQHKQDVHEVYIRGGGGGGGGTLM